MTGGNSYYPALTVENVMRPVISIIVTLILVLVASSTLNGLFGDYSQAVTPAGAAMDQKMQELGDVAETGLKIALVLAVVLAGVMYTFGLGRGQPAPGEIPRTNGNTRPIETQISLSAEAVAVRKRISTSIIKLREMPSDTVSAEMKVDLAAIRERHLPDLEKAHRTARRIYPETGPEAEALDKDLTASLEQIATRLDEMIEECGREARSDFATQRRFIELRHPTTAEDPLALPQVRMVDAGA